MSLLFNLEPDTVAVRVSADHINEVLSHWASYHPHGRPGDKERKYIVARFNEGYTVAQLCRAIDGLHRSPFHCGENDRGMKYLNIPVCFRDSSQVEKFIELANDDGPVLSEKTKRTVRAMSNWAKREDAS